jgi:hypothetical protein
MPGCGSQSEQEIHTFLRFFDSDPEAAFAWSKFVVGIGDRLRSCDCMLDESLLEQCICLGSSLWLVFRTGPLVVIFCAHVISNFTASCGTMLGMNGACQFCVVCAVS